MQTTCMNEWHCGQLYDLMLDQYKSNGSVYRTIILIILLVYLYIKSIVKSLQIGFPSETEIPKRQNRKINQGIDSCNDPNKISIRS